MAASSPGVGVAKTITLATTHTLITPTGGCKFVYVSCSAVVNVEYGIAADGAALGANYFQVPANTLFPIPVVGPAIGIAAASGTPVAYLLGAL